MERIEGAILAAGRGERLRARGPDLPKPLAVLDGEPLLSRQTRSLLDAGAERVIAVVNSETAALIRRDSVRLPERLTVVVRDTPNSMETLFTLGEHLTTPWFLAATVDAILPPGEMRRFLDASRALACNPPQPPADAALGVVRWRGDERPLFVEVAEGGRLHKVGAAQGELVTAGVYFLPRTVFAWRSRARAENLSALRQFLAASLEWGLKLYAVELRDAVDIDVQEDLQAARRMLGRSGASDSREH